MSILNQSSVGLHSVLTAIFKLLAAERKPLPRARVEALCAPPSAVNPQKLPRQVPQTISNWLKLGLFQEQEEDLAIHPDVPARDRHVGALPRLARQRALHPDNNQDLWANVEANAADFTRAVTWLLAQDVYTTELRGWETEENFVLRQLPQELLDEQNKDKRFIVNNTRWSALRVWTVWLGFGWNSAHPKGVLVIDPTEAVRDALPLVFAGQQRLDAETVVQGLAQALPVLDEGEYRRAVENKFRERTDATAWQPQPAGQLSTSLSRAFLRLIQDGTLHHENLSDAPRRVHLTGRGRTILRTISHFTLNH